MSNIVCLGAGYIRNAIRNKLVKTKYLNLPNFFFIIFPNVLKFPSHPPVLPKSTCLDGVGVGVSNRDMKTPARCCPKRLSIFGGALHLAASRLFSCILLSYRISAISRVLQNISRRERVLVGKFVLDDRQEKAGCGERLETWIFNAAGERKAKGKERRTLLFPVLL